MKSIIRTEVLSHLKRLSVEDKTEASLSIQNFLQFELKNETGVWAGYQSLSNEPAIDWQLAAPHLKWVFPVCVGEVLEFRSSEAGFENSEFGIPTPVSGIQHGIQEISGFVIPALGYDLQGYRLGRGRGYYDRSLNQIKNKKIGVCFQVSFCESLPVESHDLCCDKVITEKQVYTINKVKTSQGDQKWK